MKIPDELKTILDQKRQKYWDKLAAARKKKNQVLAVPKPITGPKFMKVSK